MPAGSIRTSFCVALCFFTINASKVQKRRGLREHKMMRQYGLESLFYGGRQASVLEQHRDKNAEKDQ